MSSTPYILQNVFYLPLGWMADYRPGKQIRTVSFVFLIEKNRIREQLYYKYSMEQDEIDRICAKSERYFHRSNRFRNHAMTGLFLGLILCVLGDDVLVSPAMFWSGISLTVLAAVMAGLSWYWLRQAAKALDTITRR